MYYILGLVILFIGLNSGLSKSYSTEPSDSVRNIVHTIDFINNSANRKICYMDCMSDTRSRDSHFKSNKDMINNICTQENQSMSLSQLRQYLRSRGTEDILERQQIQFDTFVDNLYFFL